MPKAWTVWPVISRKTGSRVSFFNIKKAIFGVCYVLKNVSWLPVIAADAGPASTTMAY